MPRPEYIARLHAAKYDLRWCAGSEKRQMLERYKEALETATKQAGLSAPLLEAAIARDFGEWIKQEKLPLPPPQIRGS